MDSSGDSSSGDSSNRKMRTDSKQVFEKGLTGLADNLDKCVDRVEKSKYHLRRTVGDGRET